MKNIYFILVIFLSFFLASCTSSDDETLVNDGERKLRHLTITQVENDATTRSLFDLTRASLTENEADNTLSASWTARDELSLCILTDLGSPISSIGTLTTLSPGETSAFSTDIVCGNGDYIAVVYPNNNVNITPTSNDVTFILNLSGQDGTLGTLATNYHFIYGLSKITSVTDNTASATIKMNSLLTICKFSFVDESDNPIFIKDLFICYGTSFGDFPKNTYPTSASITLSANSQSNTVNANGILDQNDNILTIRSNGLNEIYVALLPTGERDFIFKVINDNGTYEGRATAILNAGEFVPAPNLKLTKQTNNY